MQVTTEESWRRLRNRFKGVINNAKKYPESTNIIFQVTNYFWSHAKPGMFDREDVEEMERLIKKQIGTNW